MSLKNFFSPSNHQKKDEFDSLLDNLSKREDIFSCISHFKSGRYLHISPSFYSLTQYPVQELATKGVNFFTEYTHPEDILQQIEKQAEAFQEVFKPDFNPELPNFCEITFRLKHPEKGYASFNALITAMAYLPSGAFDFALVAGFNYSASESSPHFKTRMEAMELLANAKELYRTIYPQPVFENISRNSLTELFNETSPKHVLTPKEKEVLKQIANGKSTKEIAVDLDVSDNTIETHRKNLLEKFEANNMAELIKKTSKLYWLE